MMSDITLLDFFFFMIPDNSDTNSLTHALAHYSFPFPNHKILILLIRFFVLFRALWFSHSFHKLIN